MKTSRGSRRRGSIGRPCSPRCRIGRLNIARSQLKPHPHAQPASGIPLAVVARLRAGMACQRKREPPGRHSTRRSQHRRAAHGSRREISSDPPEQHRRGAVRRDCRLRCDGAAAASPSTCSRRIPSPSGPTRCWSSPTRRKACTGCLARPGDRRLSVLSTRLLLQSSLPTALGDTRGRRLERARTGVGASPLSQPSSVAKAPEVL